MRTPEESLERLYTDVWNGENPEAADELVHETYVIHDRDLAAELQGPELYKALASATREIFPDMTFEIADVVAAGETVAVRWTMTGTHRGELFGVEPTGRQVELPAIEFNRFEDGMLIETWTQSDQFGLLHQLGVDPTAE
ncbi:ester cyclase [Natrialba asiatica]|uniref:Putative cyclase n=1 Tax=Natrialba asiatica (strain ATCC 700177 / DSM 12278 / JCM 9576 / FERM P-10747 / NBRC 102637 / 172P1) TaxID=29540 RepID=M0AV25_NATA1|nr:ester cyclase [Natrialba asiatica]ELZ02536.1 putative cyclase [Natrialba asiatica DSM 12278]